MRFLDLDSNVTTHLTTWVLSPFRDDICQHGGVAFYWDIYKVVDDIMCYKVQFSLQYIIKYIKQKILYQLMIPKTSLKNL